jgi:glycosyltransferase involved in cell wall biosynthesis
LRVQNQIDVTVCYSTPQLRLAREKLGLKRDQAALVLHPADSAFWRPAASDEEREADEALLREAGVDIPADTRVICSAGLEFRDYPTLIDAARQLPKDVQVVIAASSPWSKRKNTAEEVELPANVRRVSLKPLQLRALYRRSVAAAIPLYNVDFQAGSLVAYEAMACGKPVVITKTRGQVDIVKDKETGFYVIARDPNSMAHALNRLLDEPRLAPRLGENSRRVVEQGLNLDTYLNGMIELVKRVAAKHAVANPALNQANHITSLDRG